MDSIQRLAKLFENFPGIGPRQAKRFVYYLLTRNSGFLDELSNAVVELKKEIRTCGYCQRFFPKNKGNSTNCPICIDPNRDNSSLMIVSRDVDLENIEKTHSFNGLYFVLGGTVPILEKEPEKRIRTKELIYRLETLIKNNSLKEIILAMSLNPEGENTSEFIKKTIETTLASHQIKISTLGRGLSTGTELEYSDGDTIKNALKNRQ